MSKIKIGAKVRWLFGNGGEYIVMGTQLQPYKQADGTVVQILSGGDLLLLPVVLKTEGITPFGHAHSQHVDLVM